MPCRVHKPSTARYEDRHIMGFPPSVGRFIAVLLAFCTYTRSQVFSEKRSYSTHYCEPQDTSCPMAQAEGTLDATMEGSETEPESMDTSEQRGEKEEDQRGENNEDEEKMDEGLEREDRPEGERVDHAEEEKVEGEQKREDKLEGERTGVAEIEGAQDIPKDERLDGAELEVEQKNEEDNKHGGQKTAFKEERKMEGVQKREEDRSEGETTESVDKEKMEEQKREDKSKGEMLHGAGAEGEEEDKEPEVEKTEPVAEREQKREDTSRGETLDDGAEVEQEQKRSEPNVERTQSIEEKEPVKRKETESVMDEEVDTKKAKPTAAVDKKRDTLKGFGYAFNEKGQLRQISKEDQTLTDQPFMFMVSKDQKYNQEHYEALGEVITEYVYKKLQTEAKLKKIRLPLDAKHGEPRSFVFASDDASTTERLMVLIHGSGVVRAGQWARRLIINDCLDSGTQLPFIRRAREEGYGVLVLNTNENHDKKSQPIRGNSTPEEHACYVWERVMKECKAKEVYIVAHSYGGSVVTDLADHPEFGESFRRHVKKIAFTDSVHNFNLQRTTRATREWMTSHAKNWVSSRDPLDKKLTKLFPSREVPRVSAGTPKHEETSSRSINSIFMYFKK